jgi:hypothetical protein
MRRGSESRPADAHYIGRARGVLMPPGPAVDGQSVVSGHLLSVHQVKWILTGRAKAE